jgi:hypothetical protein
VSFDLPELCRIFEKYGIQSATDLEEQLSARFEVVDGPQWEVVDGPRPEVAATTDTADNPRLYLTDDCLLSAYLQSSSPRERMNIILLQILKNLLVATRIPRKYWGKYFELWWPLIIEHPEWNVTDVEERFLVAYSQETGLQFN